MLIILFVFSIVTILVSILYALILGESVTPEYMLNIVLMSVLPIFYEFYGFVQKDHKRNMSEHRFTFVLISIILAIFIFGFVQIDVFTKLSFIIFIFVLFGFTDSRILFILSFVYLLTVLIFLILLNEDYPEYFGLESYYAMILGVFAYLINTKLRNIVSQFVAPFHEPKWWNKYMLEIQNLVLDITKIFPFIIISLIAISYSPWSSIVNFDEQFLSSMILIYGVFLPLLVPPTLISRIILIILCGITYIFMFETYIEGMLACLLFFGILIFSYKKFDWLNSRYEKIHAFLSTNKEITF